MRKLAVLLILLGGTGLVLGTGIIVKAERTPGAMPFSHETYGGPGPMIGALILLFGGLYLFSSARRED